GGLCNLRFDDTNPAREDPEFVQAIQDDVRWLGFDWAALRHASDYFEVFYLGAEKLIRQGDAYVCDLTPEQIREYRGTLTEPGRAATRRTAPAAGRKPSTCSGACAPASARTPRAPCARRSTWPAATSPCATRRCTGSRRSRTRPPAMPGRSIRCTTTRTRWATRSRASPTRCARWSSSTTGS